MRAGIIAAGWGTRLGRGPKALTPIAGRPLIDHVIEGLVGAGARGITCIVNEASAAVVEHVTRGWPSLDLDWIVRTTPSSMHSFVAVLERLAAEGGHDGCLLTTVDSVCRPGTTRDFARAAAALAAPLVLGVTDVIDDEKPLYAVPRTGAVAGSGQACQSVRPGQPFEIGALTSSAGASPYVTAGFYWASPPILAERATEAASRFTSLREFLGAVVTAGHVTWGVPLPPVIDVDRPADVEAATRLMSSNRHVLRGY